MLKNSLKNVEVKRKPRGYNSFIAPHNNYTYQMDIFFISKDDIEVKQKFRAGLVMIDVLSKYSVVVPIKSKTPPDIIAGTMEALQKFGKKPKIIYTDDERGIASSDFKEYVDSEGIELYRTKINYSRELSMMRKRESKESNGLTI